MKKGKKEVNEVILKKLKDYNKSASDISIYTYGCNIMKIYEELGHKDYNPSVFKNYNNIIEWLEKNYPNKNTLKNRLASVVIWLKANGYDDKIISKYSDKIEMLSYKIDRDKSKMQWTDKEEDTLLSIKELHLYIDKLEQDLPKEINNYNDARTYMEYIAGNFHSLYAPRNELSDMKILSNNEYDDDEKNNNENYMIVDTQKNKVKVVYNRFKTEKTYGSISFDIDNKDLIKYIIKYYNTIKDGKFNNDKWFIFKKNGSKLTRNEYTKFLQQTFKNTGKNISSSMLRKIVASSLYDVSKIKQMSMIMQHSIGQAIKSYVKN
jgi:hypothetical protein